MTTTVERFETALEDLEVPVRRTTPAAFDETLGRVANEPVVGTPLPFEGVSLPAWVDDEPTPGALESATTGVTAASLGVADYGSVVLPSTPEGSEPVSLFPERHVAVLRERDLVADMPTAIERLGPELRDGGSAVIATGPSATADMGALVKGAHGPKEVRVVLITDAEDADGGEP
ncbi:L-lactate dehydrogenase complex protein LldG [Halobiforma haloterrestris]|uniref:L-lactate dehydrogenase complex protein LldG n=1 Tax=Natronobacterium haloterrestre TaxID=148448 RepID=A0A1I1DAE4_NATHA|nr:LUD domain-containing protein [Halobiforma haloterrestris]SFB71784.1 L-lactate dehydrogenase complex protein LldG [Halobiforma haloterrestris]